MIFIGLGSNMGERQNYLTSGVRNLCQNQIHILSASALYETEPWGNTDQPVFLNAVISAEYDGSPEEVLQILQETELKLGRVRTQIWGPRTLDLDILAIDQIRIQTHTLKVPHPAISERAFVLVPWAEIAPDFRPSPQGLSVQEMLLALPPSEIQNIRKHIPARDWLPAECF